MNVVVTARRSALSAVAIVAVAIVAIEAAAVALPADATVTAAATLFLIGNTGGRSRGIGGLVAWIVGGALLGGAVGYGAQMAVQIPLSTAGAVGLGLALGGGLGGISHLLSIDEPSAADDERMTVDMGSQSTADPRPADLFDDHPDPVLYVTDTGAGPVVRAANAAYEAAFDLPVTTIEDTPLSEVLLVADSGVDVADRVADGERVDDVVALETPDGPRRYRVRSVAATEDGYLLFTPVED